MKDSTLILTAFLRVYCSSGRVGVKDIVAYCKNENVTVKEYTVRQWYKSALLDGLVFRRGRFYYFNPESEIMFLMCEATRRAGY